MIYLLLWVKVIRYKVIYSSLFNTGLHNEIKFVNSFMLHTLQTMYMVIYIQVYVNT